MNLEPRPYDAIGLFGQCHHFLLGPGFWKDRSVHEGVAPGIGNRLLRRDERINLAAAVPGSSVPIHIILLGQSQRTHRRCHQNCDQDGKASLGTTSRHGWFYAIERYFDLHCADVIARTSVKCRDSVHTMQFNFLNIYLYWDFARNSEHFGIFGCSRYLNHLSANVYMHYKASLISICRHCYHYDK